MQTTTIKVSQVERTTKARKIAKQCGHYAAAKMLKNRGYSLSQARSILFTSNTK